MNQYNDSKKWYTLHIYMMAIKLKALNKEGLGYSLKKTSMHYYGQQYYEGL